MPLPDSWRDTGRAGGASLDHGALAPGADRVLRLRPPEAPDGARYPRHRPGPGVRVQGRPAAVPCAPPPRAGGGDRVRRADRFPDLSDRDQRPVELGPDVWSGPFRGGAMA